MMLCKTCMRELRRGMLVYAFARVKVVGCILEVEVEVEAVERGGEGDFRFLSSRDVDTFDIFCVSVSTHQIYINKVHIIHDTYEKNI